MIVGTVRGLGTYYVDDVECMEIHIAKQYDHFLPNIDGTRVSIKLRVGNRLFTGGIRSTARNSYIWICPDLLDESENKTSLGHLLPGIGFEKNQKINIAWADNQLILS